MKLWRRVSIGLHDSEDYLKLTPQPPNGRSLFLHLLIGPCTTVWLPGLYRYRLVALAADLEWKPAAVKKVFAELSAAGVAFFNEAKNVIYVPNAVNHNPPDSLTQLVKWGRLYENIPNCPEKGAWLRGLAVHCEGRGGNFPDAFEDSFGGMRQDAERMAADWVAGDGRDAGTEAASAPAKRTTLEDRYSAEVVRLSERLATHVQEKAGVKVARSRRANFAKWIDTLMRKTDPDAGEELIAAVIDWVWKEECWWYGKVQTGAFLQRKWGTLKMQYLRDGQGGQAGGVEEFLNGGPK